jgi:hypothetical protein
MGKNVYNHVDNFIINNYSRVWELRAGEGTLAEFCFSSINSFQDIVYKSFSFSILITINLGIEKIPG